MEILYDTKLNDIYTLLKKIRDDGGKINVTELEVILSPSRTSTAIRNFKRLGLIINESGMLKLTETGVNLIYSDEEERKKILFDCIYSLRPYKALFDKIKYEKVEVIDIDYVQNIWGILGNNVNRRIITSAFPLLCAILEDHNLGEDKRGSFSFINDYQEILISLIQKKKESINYNNVDLRNKPSGMNNENTDIHNLNNIKIRITSEMSLEQINTIFDRIERLSEIINKVEKK